jgi:hypothetical protein
MRDIKTINFEEEDLFGEIIASIDDVILEY